MKQNQILITLLIALLLFAGCCKEDEAPPPYNELNGRSTAVFNPDKNYRTVSDIDGNVYKTIVIGTQIWMAENLRVTRYRNGDAVPNVTANDEWSLLTSGAYCNYNNTENLDTIASYGRLYNWYAVSDSRNIAPKGWRVATTDDWNMLIDHLGGDAIAGGKLKEAGDLHWDAPNDADNSSGFTAQPGGWRHINKDTEELSYFGMYWTSGQNAPTTAARVQLFCWDADVLKGFNFKNNGYSIRCIKEQHNVK